MITGETGNKQKLTRSRGKERKGSTPNYKDWEIKYNWKYMLNDFLICCIHKL